MLGGDQSQASGSISGMKNFMSDAKLIKIDSKFDQKSNSLLYGKSHEWGRLEAQKEVCHFGVRNYEHSQLTSEYDTLVFEPNVCNSDQMTEIKNHVNQYFSQFGNYSLES